MNSEHTISPSPRQPSGRWLLLSSLLLLIIGIETYALASTAATTEVAESAHIAEPAFVGLHIDAKLVADRPSTEDPSTDDKPQEVASAPPPLTLLGDTLFDFDSADLNPDVLDRLHKEITVFIEPAMAQNATLVVEGHTDIVGSDEHNEVLSQNRADAVAAQLIQAGYPAAKITTTSFGSTQLNPEFPPDSAAQRRVRVRAVPPGEGE